MDELAALGVVVRELPLAARDREVLGGRVIRAGLAPVGVLRGADQLGDPEPPLGVQHRVVGAVAPGGRAFRAPVRRGYQRGRAGVRIAALRHGDARRHVHPHRAVGHRIGNDQSGAADAVHRAVRIQVGVALVAGDLVVHHRHRVAPAPHRQDEVALLPLGTRRRRRDLARRDAIGPVGEQAERARSTHPVQPRAHAGTAAPDLHAMLPGVQGRVEVVQVQHRHLAGRHVAHLMTELAAVLQSIDPLGLVPHPLADAVAVGSRARELVLGRHFQQGVPVVGGVNARRFLRGGGRRYLQGELVARARRVLPGVDQAVAAHPHLVVGVRQVRDQEPPVVAGDDDLAERGLEVIGLRDDPDARLATAGAPHDAGDVVARRRRVGAGQPQHAAGQEHRSQQTDPGCRPHINLP